MGRFDFILTFGMLIGQIACLRSGGHVVGRIRNTVENITSVVARVFGEYVPHCYVFELGLPSCRGCMDLSSYGTANLSCQSALILTKISRCQDLYCVLLIFNFLFLENGLPRRREVFENDV
jgi:hypothetical protein